MNINLSTNKSQILSPIKYVASRVPTSKREIEAELRRLKDIKNRRLCQFVLSQEIMKQHAAERRQADLEEELTTHVEIKLEDRLEHIDIRDLCTMPSQRALGGVAEHNL